MALVSSLYRMAPSEAWHVDDATRRVRVAVRRVVATHGKDAAALRVRAWTPRDVDEAVRLTRIGLEIAAVRLGHAAGSAG